MFPVAHAQMIAGLPRDVWSTIRSVRPSFRLGPLTLVVATAILTATAAPQLDPPAARWVTATLEGMTLDQKVGQLIMPSFRSTYLSSDSDVYDELVSRVHEQHVGGFLLFGGREPAPDVLLGAGYARSVPGQPLAAASIANRLQAISALPLLNSADFETGVGFRIGGATTFPRAMAFGAAGDDRLAFEAGRITALEARALGIHVNFAPVADVNNNPRNPVINTRSFGEDPAMVARLAAAYVRGLTDGGMIATLKHFPGHGDTDVDSHLGLPLIAHPRARLDRVELPPFRAGIAAGAAAVMTSHIELPGLEPEPARPATFSRRIVTDLLREELGFDGLIYTDSMRMRGVTDLVSASEAAVRAVAAGHDVVVHSPDDAAVFDGLKQAVERGEITVARLDASVRRILEAKARLGLPPDPGGRPRHGAAHRGHAGPPGRGGRGEPSWDDARQGRTERRAVAGAATRGSPLLVGARLPVGVGKRRAEPDVPARAREALAQRDGGRGVRPHLTGRARAAAREHRPL